MAKNEGATPPEVDASVLTEEALTAAAENAEKALAEAIYHAGGLRYSQDGLKYF